MTEVCDSDVAAGAFERISKSNKISEEALTPKLS
jgi:hypothetical protein